jgi:tRNA threonylcarbamoyladenosine biosynthesis protein TsaE
MKHYRSNSSEETKKLGRKLAKQLSSKRSSRKNALVLALKGELGAGKTTFVQGFFTGLGLKKRAPSPTFVIMRRHAIRHKRFANLFHIDAYRLKNAKQTSVLNFETIIADPQNIILIEWADRIKKLLPKDAVRLEFSHSKKENERRITAK